MTITLPAPRALSRWPAVPSSPSRRPPARPAAADDTLTVIGASSTTGFFEVLDQVAADAGFFKAEHLDVQKQYIASAAALVTDHFVAAANDFDHKAFIAQAKAMR